MIRTVGTTGMFVPGTFGMFQGGSPVIALNI